MELGRAHGEQPIPMGGAGLKSPCWKAKRGREALVLKGTELKASFLLNRCQLCCSVTAESESNQMNCCTACEWGWLVLLPSGQLAVQQVYAHNSTEIPDSRGQGGFMATTASSPLLWRGAERALSRLPSPHEEFAGSDPRFFPSTKEIKP